MMNLSRVIMLVFALNMGLYGSCYVPCDAYAESKSMETENAVNNAFDELDSVIDDSEDAYKEYLKSLEKQNELYEKITKARKYNTLMMKKANFLLKKIIDSKNVNINKEIVETLIRLNNENIKIKEIK